MAPRSQRATMRDVAALAGVSFKTVSRVVNGEPGVSSPTVERVQAAIAHLNYRHDLTAGSLRRGDRRTSSIGLVFSGVHNPFDGTVQRAVELAAARRGVAVLAASTDERPEREKTLVAALLARRVDGLVIMPAGADQSYLLPDIEAGLPVVMVDRPPVGITADCVITDHKAAAQRAVEHLIHHGHRRIALLGDLAHIASVRARMDGYAAALGRAGIPWDPTLVAVDLHSEGVAFHTARRLLTAEDAPTAIFAAQNLVTYGVLEALYATGRQHRVALCGFDDFPLARFLSPALTVVSQDPYAIGRLAAQRLFARLDRPTAPVVRVTVPATLIPRGSGELPAT